MKLGRDTALLCKEFAAAYEEYKKLSPFPRTLRHALRRHCLRSQCKDVIAGIVEGCDPFKRWFDNLMDAPTPRGLEDLVYQAIKTDPEGLSAWLVHQKDVPLEIIDNIKEIFPLREFPAPAAVVNESPHATV